MKLDTVLWLVGLVTSSIIFYATPAAAEDRLQPRATWPNTPFRTSGRWILDASGNNVTYAGVNWPGHLEAMIPEGLQYQSIDSIVSQIKSLGMNAVRLTWAVQMVDEIFENGGQDIDIKTSLTTALGNDNGTDVYNMVVDNNPSFGQGTKRLQVGQNQAPRRRSTG
jgi:hypothetical protein